jgi:hypothetical protein
VPLQQLLGRSPSASRSRSGPRGDGKRLQRPTAEGGTCRRERKLDTRASAPPGPRAPPGGAQRLRGVVRDLARPGQFPGASTTGRARPPPPRRRSRRRRTPCRARCSRMRSWTPPWRFRPRRQARQVVGEEEASRPSRSRAAPAPRRPRRPRTACRGRRARSRERGRAARRARGSTRGRPLPAAARRRRGGRRGRAGWRLRALCPASRRGGGRGPRARPARPACGAPRATGGGEWRGRPFCIIPGRARPAGTRFPGFGRPSPAR